MRSDRTVASTGAPKCFHGSRWVYRGRALCVGTVLPSSACPGTGSPSARGCGCANRSSGEGWVCTNLCWLDWAVCSSGLSWTGSCTFRRGGYTWLLRNWLLHFVCLCWGPGQTLAQELVLCPRDGRARWWQSWGGDRAGMHKNGQALTLPLELT